MEPVPWPIPLSFFEYWSILINVIPLFYFYQHLEKIIKNKLGLLRTTKKKSKMYVFKVLFERKMKKNQLFWLIMKISKGKTGLSLCRNHHRFSAFWLRSKCSICSYQLNIWYGLHSRSRILNWFLTDWVHGWACSPEPAGCHGLALHPCVASFLKNIAESSPPSPILLIWFLLPLQSQVSRIVWNEQRPRNETDFLASLKYCGFNGCKIWERVKCEKLWKTNATYCLCIKYFKTCIVCVVTDQ